jgi:fructose-1,6-bisphosphatase/inositol monophosphatase family enzyme
MKTMFDHSRCEEISRRLVRVGERVRDHSLYELRRQSAEELSAVAFESPADKIYVIDRAVENILLPALAEELAPVLSFVLICEGVNDEEPLPFPEGKPIDECEARLIIDPIDGTRPLMYNKRSAWFLAGLAPNRGEDTSLEDIEVAVQVELPTTRAAVADALWATRGGGAYGETTELATGKRTPLRLSPSKAMTACGGFASLVHFFPGGKQILVAIEEEVAEKLYGDLSVNRTALFDDQYISTGGQLYELMVGHDRMIADVRGLLFEQFVREGRAPGHACHPYDACTALIAEEVGVIITDGRGGKLDAPFDTTTDVCWIGYANTSIRAEIEPVLMEALAKRGLV